MEFLIPAAVAVVVVLFLVTRHGGKESLDVNYDQSEGERQAHRWGYTDTRFEFDGPRSVRVTGSRYPLSGYSMPKFIPFAEEVLGLPIRQEEIIPEIAQKQVAAPVLAEGFRAALGQAFEADQISVDDADRLVHSHGQVSVDEVYRLLYVGPLRRVVDVVVYPQSEDDVRHLVEMADDSGVCLVPYGGGTNVSGALTCPSAERRTIVSVDMRRMKRILSVDEENLTACVEAGISGKELERALGEIGYITGHDPDSVELSTLGGWIATNASGMKKNRYGNIEDIVLEATLVTPTGEIESRHITPRNSTGIQPRVFLFGNEGNFGIITKATIKVHPLPEVREYGALVFRDFETGVRFLKELRQERAIPASIRLVNNFEFRFGQALKAAPSLAKGILDKLQKFVVLHVKRFKEFDMVASTIVMEGTKREVDYQRRVIFGLAKKHKALSAGAKNGKRGYTLTFGIAYIRDFFNQFQIMGESFETSVPWDRIHAVAAAVKDELASRTQAAGIAGKPYLAYRVTQTYHSGVCMYFTLGFSAKGLEHPHDVYHEVERALRQVILDNGGSLSHHHGVGKLRQGFLPQIQSENSLAVLRQTKKAMDPNNVFGVGNGAFADTTSADTTSADAS